MTKILQGHCVALFAFDVGYEVSLEKLAALFSATPIQPLSRKRQTPTYLQYTKAPVTLALQNAEKLSGVSGTLEATIFDFGAVSMAYRWPLAADDSGLPLHNLAALSAELHGRNLETEARQAVSELVDKISSAIDRPRLSGLVEDYYLFIIEKLDPSLGAKDLFTRHRCELAQALSFETAPLSGWQQEETLSQYVSYLESDLTIVDWNAALIYDRDYEDTAHVLELLNVELLEARYIDRTLDQRVNTYAGLLQAPPAWPIPLRSPYRRALHELTEWRLESTLLSERVTNSLKLIGDLYLSRIHAAAAIKVHLPDWEKMVLE